MCHCNRFHNCSHSVKWALILSPKHVFWVCSIWCLLVHKIMVELSYEIKIKQEKLHNKISDIKEIVYWLINVNTATDCCCTYVQTMVYFSLLVVQHLSCYSRNCISDSFSYMGQILNFLKINNVFDMSPEKKIILGSGVGFLEAMI